MVYAPLIVIRLAKLRALLMKVVGPVLLLFCHTVIKDKRTWWYGSNCYEQEKQQNCEWEGLRENYFVPWILFGIQSKNTTKTCGR